ncbi:hypothetical protein ACLKA6_010133 [Drosophila palustris]
MTDEQWNVRLDLLNKTESTITHKFRNKHLILAASLTARTSAGIVTVFFSQKISLASFAANSTGAIPLITIMASVEMVRKPEATRRAPSLKFDSRPLM